MSVVKLPRRGSNEDQVLKKINSLIPLVNERWWNAFKESGCVIAGSVVLHALKPDFDTWKPNDVDIWIPFQKKSKNTIMSILEEAGYKLKKSNRSVKNLNSYSRLRKYISEIYFFEKEYFMNIQVIIAAPRTKIDDIILSFDIVATQFSFSYIEDSFKIKDVSDGIATLDIENNIMRISDVATSLQSFYEWARTLQRLCKYEKRGFDILESEVLKIVGQINKTKVIDRFAYPIYQDIINYFDVLGYSVTLDKKSHELSITSCDSFSKINMNTMCFLNKNVKLSLSDINAQNQKRKHDGDLQIAFFTEELQGTILQNKDLTSLRLEVNTYYSCEQSSYEGDRNAYIKLPLFNENFFVPYHHFNFFCGKMLKAPKNIKWIFGLVKSNPITTINKWITGKDLLSKQNVSKQCIENDPFVVYNLRWIPVQEHPKTLKEPVQELIKNKKKENKPCPEGKYRNPLTGRCKKIN